MAQQSQRQTGNVRGFAPTSSLRQQTKWSEGGAVPMSPISRDDSNRAWGSTASQQGTVARVNSQPEMTERRISQL